MFRYLLLLTLSLAALSAATIHVMPTGQDAVGRGAADAPLRTLAYACGRAVAGDTVQLAAGTYQETAQALLPGRVRVVGAGRAVTTVRVPTAWDYRGDVWTENLGGYLIRINGVGGSSVEGLTLDGNGARANGAIHGADVGSLELRDLIIRDFRYFGLRFVASRRLDLRRIVLRNSGFEHQKDSATPFPDGGSLGSIGLDHVADSVFDDIDIATNAPHGYGMKLTAIDRCVFARLRFAMHPFQSWGNDTLGGGAGNFDLEVHGGHIRQSDFHHCHFTATLSLMGGTGADYDNVDYSVHLHHNRFDLGGDYGIEFGTDKLVIDHNDFTDAWSMVQNYGDALTRLRELTFCHNAVRGVGMRVIGSKGDTDLLRIFNNTFVYSQDGWQGHLLTIGAQNDSSQWAIVNNVLLGDQTAAERWLVEAYNTTTAPTDLTVHHNLMRHLGLAVDVGGTLADPVANRHVYASNRSDDPLLDLGAATAQRALLPPAGSPLIDAGDAAWGMRSAFSGAGRDLGVFERGETPWTTGPDSTDDCTYVWAPRTLCAETAFAATLDVDLYTAQTGTEIRYTLDGSEPHAASTLYQAPVHLDADARLRARCFRDGWGSPTCLVRDFRRAADGYPNLSHRRPATASSTWPEGDLYLPAKAVDGDTFNWIGWTGASGDDLPWLRVDLGTPQRIRAIELHTRAIVDSGADQRASFAIQGSNDPAFATFTTLASQGATPLPFQGVFRATVTVATPFRYVRAIKTVAGSFFITELVVRGEPANLAPAAALLAPTVGQRASGAFAVVAHAADPEGALARVEFLADGVVVGTDAAAPFTYTWTGATGWHTLAARAVDTGGASAVSADVQIEVVAPRARAVGLRRISDHDWHAEAPADTQVLSPQGDLDRFGFDAGDTGCFAPLAVTAQ